MNDDPTTLLRARLDRQVEYAPPEPALVDVIDQCELDLVRHRRRLTGVTVAAVAAGVAIAVGMPTLIGGNAGGADDMATGPSGTEQSALVEACRNGSQPAYWTDLIFGSGTPRVAGYSAVTEQTSVVLVSADDDYWADCFNADGAMADASVTMTVHASEPSSIAPYSAGPACLNGREALACDRFIVDYLDRLPSTVKQVEFVTADGVKSRVETNADGFVLFDYEGTNPDTYRQKDSRTTPWIAQITYLNDAGVTLASNRFPRLTPVMVPGVPQLSDYPSLSRTITDSTPPSGQ